MVPATHPERIGCRAIVMVDGLEHAYENDDCLVLLPLRIFAPGKNHGSQSGPFSWSPPCVCP